MPPGWECNSLSNPNIKEKRNGKNLHDTEKPVELMKILIENSSSENDVVLDPFMGIGSTVIASKLLNRQYMGIEIDKNYYDIANDRIAVSSTIQEFIQWQILNICYTEHLILEVA